MTLVVRCSRLYLTGDFTHGMQLGAELIYVGASASDATITSIAAGFAAGPFVGYKVIADIGFTFEAQLGVQYVFAQGEASSNDSDVMVEASQEESALIPLLNINLGWSF